MKFKHSYYRDSPRQNNGFKFVNLFQMSVSAISLSPKNIRHCMLIETATSQAPFNLLLEIFRKNSTIFFQEQPNPLTGQMEVVDARSQVPQRRRQRRRRLERRGARLHRRGERLLTMGLFK